MATLLVRKQIVEIKKVNSFFKDRGFSYRIELYKVLTRLGYHIIAFDYR